MLKVILFLILFCGIHAQLPAEYTQPPRRWTFEVYDNCGKDWVGDLQALNAWSLIYDNCYFKFIYLYAHFTNGDRIYEGDIVHDLDSDHIHVANLIARDGTLQSNLKPNGRYERLGHIVNEPFLFFGGQIDIFDNVPRL